MFLDLNNTDRLRLSLTLKTTSLLFICFLAWLWGWKTSGVLENTQLFDIYPLGYAHILDSPTFGLWPINRESTYYLNGMQGFLGVTDAYINLGNGYEISRTFYCLMLRTFWFLEPIVASVVLDIILWFLAALSAAFITATFSKNKLAPWIAALSVVFGQGFLHSVGEGMPHVLGYAGGFYVGALICLFRTWQKKCTVGEDLVIYVFLALWQIGYGTALFYLPLALLSSWHRMNEQNKEWHIPYTKRVFMIFAYIFISVFPFLVITTLSRVITKMPGEMGIILHGMKSYSSIMAYLVSYSTVFIDGLLSLGPITTIAIVWFLGIRFFKKYTDLNWLCTLFLIQFMTMIFLIVPLVGRGYATFNVIMIPIIFFARALSDLITKINILSARKYAYSLFLFAILAMMLYPHSMKLGFRMPNYAFHVGWLNALNTKLQNYEIQYFN